jgi:hypothetical protein
LKKTLLASILLFTIFFVTGCNLKNDIKDSYAFIYSEEDFFNVLKLQIKGKKVTGIFITHSIDPSNNSKDLIESKKVLSGSFDGEKILFIGDIYNTGFLKNEDLIIKDSTGEKIFTFQKASEEEMNMKLDVFKKSHHNKNDETTIEIEENIDGNQNKEEESIEIDESLNSPNFNENIDSNSDDVKTLTNELITDLSFFNENFRRYQESRVHIISYSERILNDITHFYDEPNNSYTNTCASKPESEFVEICNIISATFDLSGIIDQSNKDITNLQQNYNSYISKLNNVKKIIKDTNYEKTNENINTELSYFNTQLFDSEFEIKRNVQLLINIENETKKLELEAK